MNTATAPRAWIFALAMTSLPLLAGAPLGHAPLIFALVFAPAMVLSIMAAQTEAASGDWQPPKLLTMTRNIPTATRLLVITFAMTCLFSFELQFDMVPNAFGLFELLVPIILSAAFFDLSGGLFCAAIAVYFGFFAFAPPRFPGILDFGPSFSRTLFSFTSVGLGSVFYFTLASDGLLAGAPIRKDWTQLRGWMSDLYLLVRERLEAIRTSSALATIAVGAGLVLAYALFWATYAALSSSSGVHMDSLEAYAWGREFRLGYYKHPPFWAWVAGAWFLIFPKSHWAFWFLSELNGALGLAGAWVLMGRFCGQRTRLIGIALLMLTPFYQFNAMRFNANTVLLSLWPWSLYFFVRSIERPRVPAALAAGVLAGFALLSKYFGLVLIATCVAASLTHHNRKAYYASAAPYVSLLVAAALFAPHVIWLFHDGFQPLAYLATKIDLRDRAVSTSFFQFIGAYAAFFILPMVVLVAARWRGGRTDAPLPPSPNGQSFENVVSFSPFIFTLIAGSVGHTALAIPFGVPIFSLLPLALMRIAQPREDLAWVYARNTAIAVAAVCAIAAPFIPRVFIDMKHPDHVRPRLEAADKAIELWHEDVGQPLRFAAGDRIDSLEITFRSQEDTSEFNDFNVRWSAPVTPERLRRLGLLVVCETDDCLQRAAPYLTPASRRHDLLIARDVPGAPSFPYTVLVIPPEPD